MKKNMRQTLGQGGGPVVVILVALAALYAGPVGAQSDFNWTNTAGGVFSTDANWESFFSTAPSTDDHRALFDTGAHTYTVTFDGSVTNHSALVGATAAGSGSDVTWDLGGYTYTLANTNGESLFVGQDSDASLTVTNGHLHSLHNRFIIGNGSGAGTLHLTGTNTTMKMEDVSTQVAVVGNNYNTNRFRITGGAQVDMVRIAMGSNTRGYLEVSGTGSRLFNDHTSQLGYYSGHGEALIADGGEWEVRLGLTIGLGTANAHTGRGILRVDGGTVKARNFIFSNVSIFDVTLHTGGTNSLLTTHGTGSHGVEIGPGGLTESPETNFVLNLTSGFTSEPGEVFTLIEVGSSSAVIDGKFRIDGQVLDEGDTISIAGFDYPFQASYVGGDGNDFTLTVIPEPGALGLLVLAAVLGGLFRRRQL